MATEKLLERAEMTDSLRKVMSGEDPRLNLEENLLTSLNPRSIKGNYDLIPLPDQEANSLYVCDVLKVDGSRKSRFWLKPDWKPALEEFARFVTECGNASLKLMITSHETDEKNEHISISPVISDASGVSKMEEFSFGLTLKGRVSFGSTQFGFHDLGYLNPERLKLELLIKLKDQELEL